MMRFTNVTVLSLLNVPEEELKSAEGKKSKGAGFNLGL